MESARVLCAYERMLVHRERFALADAVRAVNGAVETLALTQPLLQVHASKHSGAASTGPATNSSSSSSKVTAATSSGRHHHAHHNQASKKPTFQNFMDAVARRVAHAEALIPVFLGESELRAFARALLELAQTPEIEVFWDLEMIEAEKLAADMLTVVLQHLELHCQALSAAIEMTGAAARHITAKRNHMARLLDDAAEILASSHTRRLRQFEVQKTELIEAFKTALLASQLCTAKRLEAEVQSLETSMEMMLLPHLEICRTVTTANAHVERAAGFASAERIRIDAFVQTAMRLKDHSVGFESVLGDARVFLTDLKLFERAASQDAFAVCSSALKLQFRESLDEELFLAYVQDWTDKRRALESVERSAEWRAADQRLADLRAQILHVDQSIRTSQAAVPTDDPIQARLRHEVELLFQEEGGTLDLYDVESASPASSSTSSAISRH